MSDEKKISNTKQRCTESPSYQKASIESVLDGGQSHPVDGSGGHLQVNGITDGYEPEVKDDPPLPPGPPPEKQRHDDGWQPVWDETFGQYYFYNSVTSETTWTNPRLPNTTNDTSSIDQCDHEKPISSTLLLAESDEATHNEQNHLQYNPAIHGDYDPTAPYAQSLGTVLSQEHEYTTVAAFNRFTGKFQSSQSHQVPEAHNDENKTRRQMEFYFDVDAAANSHDGKSLKAERQTKKLSKKELKQFKEKRRQRKEEKRKAWLKD